MLSVFFLLNGCGGGNNNTQPTCVSCEGNTAIQLSSATYAATEAAGSVSVTVTRSNGTSGPVSVKYATADGTAVAGVAYTGASGTVNWAAEDFSAKVITVGLIDQKLTSGTQQFSFTLSDVTGAASLGTPSTSTVTIADNDVVAGTIAFGASSYSVNEAAGTAVLSVTRTGGSSGGASVNYATADGTASAGTAYTATSGTLIWTDGDSSAKSVVVPILNPNLTTGSQSFTVTLSGATAASLGTPISSTVTIADNDIIPGTLAFAASDYSVNESAGTVNLSVARSGGSSGAVSVNYASANGTASAGTAYTSTTGTLNWSDGDSSAKSITVPILNPGLSSGSQTFTVTLTGATAARLGTPSTSTVTIADNDVFAGTLALAASNYVVNENAGTVTLSVNRTGGSSVAASVSYATVDGTAVAATAYTASTGTLQWADGDSSAKSITVPILNPGKTGAPETFSVLLSGAAGATLASPSTSVITILDQPGSGHTWYVDGNTGSDNNDGRSLQSAFATMQKGADAAHAGDTVLVEDGTYTVSYGAALNLSSGGSASGGYIAFEAAPGANPVVQVGAYAYQAVQFNPTASYIIFQGFTVLGNNTSLNLAGALAADGNNATEQQNIIYNGNCIAALGNSSAPASPIVSQPNHILILDNTVAYCGGGAIASLESDYITISGNTIYDSAWYTVYGSSAISTLNDYDTDTNTGYKIIVTNNTIYGNEEFIPWEAVGFITDGEGIIIDSNYNNQYTPQSIAFAPYKGRTLIANNVIYNDGSSAIEVFESAHVDVINNSTFNDNLNQATEPGRGEIGLSYLSDVNIFNNIFYSSTGGNALTLSTACTPLPCTSDYNIYYGGAVAWNGFGSDGSHDLVVDPTYTTTPTPTLTGGDTPVPTDLLNAPTAVNLELQPGSPAIGAGTPSLNGYPAPATDISGNPRPSTNGYTLGAYSQ